MVTYPYTSYTFTKPPMINEKEYDILKYNFGINPEYYPFPSGGVYERFRDGFHLLGKILFGLAIMFVLGATIKPLEWLTGLCMLALFFLFFGIIGPINSLFSYMGFLSKKNRYFRRLKKDVISSNAYEDFVAKRKGR